MAGIACPLTFTESRPWLVESPGTSIPGPASSCGGMGDCPFIVHAWSCQKLENGKYRHAANLWYRKIASTLVDTLHFSSSELDPCLFIRQDCIIVLYVDDAIILARDDSTLKRSNKNYVIMVTTSIETAISSRIWESSWTLWMTVCSNCRNRI